MDPSLAVFWTELRGAVEALVAGRPERYQECWSSAEDCTAFGAFGGVARGSSEIRARLAQVADQYEGGRYRRFEPVSEVAGTDLAVLAHLERIESIGDGGQVIVRERRVTHVVRKEDGAWRVFHQHSDPLVEPAFPS